MPLTNSEIAEALERAERFGGIAEPFTPQMAFVNMVVLLATDLLAARAEGSVTLSEAEYRRLVEERRDALAEVERLQEIVRYNAGVSTRVFSKLEDRAGSAEREAATLRAALGSVVEAWRLRQRSPEVDWADLHADAITEAERLLELPTGDK